MRVTSEPTILQWEESRWQNSDTIREIRWVEPGSILNRSKIHPNQGDRSRSWTRADAENVVHSELAGRSSIPKRNSGAHRCAASRRDGSTRASSRKSWVSRKRSCMTSSVSRRTDCDDPKGRSAVMVLQAAFESGVEFTKRRALGLARERRRARPPNHRTTELLAGQPNPSTAEPPNTSESRRRTHVELDVRDQQPTRSPRPRAAGSTSSD